METCDFEGKCNNKAYAEVYPMLVDELEADGWSYLCKKHFKQQQKALKEKDIDLPYVVLEDDLK